MEDNKKKSIKKIGTIVVAVAVVAALLAFIFGGKKDSGEVKFETAKVEKGTISSSVTATGTVEAVTSVDVGTQVSGIVTKLNVDYNSQVKKGQVIAELDKSNLQSQLTTAQDNLERARADVRTQQAAVQQQRAALQSAQASMNYQKSNYNRYATLYRKGLVSANDYESARLSYQQAAKQVAQAQEQVASAQTQVASAETQVGTAQESVKQAQTNLGYATITAPIDGVVISKSVEEGQTVASSYSTPTLVTIAKDLRDMQVVADVDEADIGNVKEGQRCQFTVDAYPDDVFTGTVKQVRQNATTTNNVVTYEVVITAPNQDLKLKPGLTANVTIYTLDRSNVTCVPSKALRFTPTPEVVGKNYKIGTARGEHVVWTLEGNKLVPHTVEIGTSDGTHTEILSGIELGTQVVVDVAVASDASNDEESSSDDTSSPFQPKRPGSDKKKSSGSNGSGSNGGGGGKSA